MPVISGIVSAAKMRAFIGWLHLAKANWLDILETCTTLKIIIGARVTKYNYGKGKCCTTAKQL